MIEISYSGLNGKINLNSDNIKTLNSTEFFSNAFTIESKPNLNGLGSYFDRVTLMERSYNFSLWVRGEEVLEEIHNLFSADLSNQIPGKLYINGTYIYCFISEVSHPSAKKYSEGEIIDCVAMCPSPLWIREEKYEFIKQIGEIEGGLQFPFSFPLAFKLSRTSQAINNRNTSSSKAELTFYGPFLEVDIGIGQYRYQVNAELLENERIVINQRDNTITKITVSGDRINMFNYRNKEQSVFKPIPPGEHIVSANMEYSFEITVFEERGMPAWNSFMRESLEGSS